MQDAVHFQWPVWKESSVAKWTTEIFLHGVFSAKMRWIAGISYCVAISRARMGGVEGKEERGGIGEEEKYF